MEIPAKELRGGDEYLTEVLPAELLERIGRHMTLADKLRLRVFPRTKQGFIDDMLKGQLDLLYVSPSRKSLNNFENICQSKFYQEHVKRVIFVARAIGGEDCFEEIDSFRQYQSEISPFSLDAVELQRSFCIYRDLVVEHKLETAPCAYHEEPSPWIASLLVQGLDALPHLKSVMLRTTIDCVGVNMSPLWLGDDPCYTKGLLDLYDIRQDRAAEAAIGLVGDIDTPEGIATLFEALGKLQRPLDALTIGHGSRDQHDRMISRFDWLESCAQSVYSKLSYLNISCANWWADDDDWAKSWQDVAESSINLKGLTLFTGQKHVKMGRRRKVPIADHFLAHGKYPKLEMLQIRSSNERKPGIIDTDCLVSFMTRHRDIEQIVLDNVLCTSHQDDDDMCKNISATLRCARKKMSKDSKFEWKVIRRNEHGDGHCTQRSPPMCDGTCERYKSYLGWVLHRFELESLAGELGVPLRDGSWDFGEYVMRGS